MTRPTRLSDRQPEGAKDGIGNLVVIGAGALLLILAGWVVLQTMGAPSQPAVSEATIARPLTVPVERASPQAPTAPGAEPGASPIPLLPPPETIAPPGPAALAQGPRLTVAALEHDFGDIHPTTPVSHVFVFTNTGAAELIIDRLTAS